MVTSSIRQQLERCDNPLLRKLFSIMIEKKTNLCLAADGLPFERVLELIDRVGQHICILKIHSEHFGGKIPHDEMMQTLFEYKKKHNFLLFEDRKYFDGGATVRLSYKSLFAKYVDIVTVVPDLGDAMFNAIRDGAKDVGLAEDEPRGCLAVCELSFKDIVRPDSQKLLEIAERNSPTCIGVIAQKLHLSDSTNMIKATPGVNLSSKSDGVNQQWRTPDQVLQDGANIIIVGRGITAAQENEWESLAIEYKEQCYRG